MERRQRRQRRRQEQNFQEARFSDGPFQERQEARPARYLVRRQSQFTRLLLRRSRHPSVFYRRPHYLPPRTGPSKRTPFSEKRTPDWHPPRSPLPAPSHARRQRQ